jgi:hypothetical protein
MGFLRRQEKFFYFSVNFPPENSAKTRPAPQKTARRTPVCDRSLDIPSPFLQNECCCPGV